jgi:hypothetical protein
MGTLASRQKDGRSENVQIPTQYRPTDASDSVVLYCGTIKPL